MQSFNYTVRFLLELCALAALGCWGFVTGQTLPLQLLLCLGAPLVAAVAWGAFVAPKARWPAREPWRLLVEIVVFGAACAALWAVHQPLLSVLLAVIYIANRLWLVRSGALA